MSTNESDNPTDKVIYPRLSFDLVAVLFEVHTALGGNLEEKYYQRAIEKALKKRSMEYKRELKFNLEFEGEKIGHNFLDFLIDDKIVLEVKAVPVLYRNDFRQVLRYLKFNNLKLGILANFRGPRLNFHRVLNSIQKGP